jgi:hypothetical protein
MLGGMTPELERWLTERLERERQALLTLVIKVVERLLNEQIRRDGEARGQEFEQEFAKLQCTVDRMQNLIEKMTRLDRAAHDQPVDSTKMN